MRAVSVIGPAQAGKTTLIEALAALEPARPQRMALDGDVSVTGFRFMDEPWAALECPGGPDHLGRIGPALEASDAVVLCVSADVDAAVVAAPYLRILEDAGMPSVIFINRIDAAIDRVGDIVAALQGYCAHGIVLRQIPLRDGDRITGAVDLISERAWRYHDGARSSLVELPSSMQAREAEARTELLEHLADFDDALLEQLVEDRRPPTEEVYASAAHALRRHDLVPALVGAASHGNGMLRLMKMLRHEVPGPEALRERFCARGEVVAAGMFADHVKHRGKIVLLRAVSDRLSPGDRLAGGSIGGLFALDGKTPVEALAPGEIGLAVKSDHLQLRAPLYGREAAFEPLDAMTPHLPNHRRLASPSNERDEARLSSALARMAEIDPALTVEQDERSGRIVLGAQGALHLRRAIEKLSDVFGIEVETVAPPPGFQETLRRGLEAHHRHRKQSGGAGQFADVVLDVRPSARGAGFAFDAQVRGGAVPKSYFSAVEAGAREALAEGPRGYPVVDVAVTLRDGKHHSVDSSDFAFRAAGRNAVREALAEAGTLVLQPISRVRIQTPSVFAGDLVQIVSGLKGQVLSFEGHPSAAGWDEFLALVPRSAEPDLFSALAGATRGTAWYTAEPERFEEVRDPGGGQP